MGVPLLIGAGVGALGAAAMGKSPFTGALLGGSLGMGAGALGAGSLLGGATAAGTTAGTLGTTGELGSALATTAGGLGTGSIALPAATSGALSGNSILAGTGSDLTGAGMMNAGQITPSMLQSVGAGGVMTNAGAIPLSMMDKAGNLLGNASNTIWDSMKSNPLGSASSASNLYSSMMQHPQMQTVQGGGVRAGNPNMVANVPEMLQISNVAPSVLPSKESKTGQIGSLNAQDILKRIPISQLFNQESI